MARLPTIADPAPDERLARMLAEVRARGVEVPNLYRVLGNAPDMLRAWLDFAWPLRLKARTPRRLRELMILRGAQISRTAYEWVHHVPMAKAAGVSQAEIDTIADWQSVASFSAAEKAALRLAEEVTRGPAASAECIEELKRHFSAEEIVELVLTASFYVCVGRILGSLEVDLEPGLAKPW